MEVFSHVRCARIVWPLVATNGRRGRATRLKKGRALDRRRLIEWKRHKKRKPDKTRSSHCNRLLTVNTRAATICFEPPRLNPEKKTSSERFRELVLDSAHSLIVLDCFHVAFSFLAKGTSSWNSSGEFSLSRHGLGNLINVSSSITEKLFSTFPKKTSLNLVKVKHAHTSTLTRKVRSDN